jgi:hypothetical protein
MNRDVWLLVGLTLLTGQGAGLDAREAARVRVLVDRSHEWLFAHDDLSERMLRPAGFEVVMCDASLDTTAKLKDFDIVFVQQASGAFPFSDDERALLKRFVEGGGRLIIVANPTCPSAGVRIPAERELDVGSLLVRYANPVASEARGLLELLPKVADFVAAANGPKPPTDRFIVNILASGGGGWSGGREIGVQCGGSMASNVAVIAHELTHSWTGPLPGILGEGWASMVGMRAAAALGFAKEAEDENRSWMGQFHRAEQASTKLDITRVETDRSVFGACEAKMTLETFRGTPR